jgi:hypothetical protein
VASGERRPEQWSNMVLFAVPVVAAIAVYAVTAEPSADIQGANREVGIVQPVRASPRCLEIDRATVIQLTTLLDRNGSADGPILERAIYTLNQARRHCVYGWDDRAFADYEWLRRWLSQQG